MLTTIAVGKYLTGESSDSSVYEKLLPFPLSSAKKHIGPGPIGACTIGFFGCYSVLLVGLKFVLKS
jgi:hypothetical protein